MKTASAISGGTGAVLFMTLLSIGGCPVETSALLAGRLAPPQYTLTLGIAGAGDVELDPPGPVYAEGTLVTLTAVARDGYGFERWEGPAPIGQEQDNPLTITMDSDKSIGALFVRHFNLVLHVQGQGTVEVETADGVRASEETFAEGAKLTLTANPDKGWTFVRWEGDLSQQYADKNPLTIIMDMDTDVTAVFVPLYVLTVTTDGEGHVDVSPDGDAFEEGTEVLLTAIAADGYGFDHWDGDVPEARTEDNPVSIVMDMDKEITAIFRARPRDGEWFGLTDQEEPISFRVSNGGTITSDLVLTGRLSSPSCEMTVTVSWDDAETIRPDGSFSASVGGPFSDVQINVSGQFLSQAEAEGEAYIRVYDYYCGYLSVSVTWTSSWDGE